MAVRVRHRVIARISKDVNEKIKLLDLDQDSVELVHDGFTHANTGTMTILPGATESIPFGDVTDAKGLYVEVDSEMDLRVNGGSENRALIRGQETTGVPAKHFTEETLTAAELEAPAGAPATGVNVLYAVWGDPTP